MTRIAVVGTAGRGSAGERLDWPTFLAMQAAVLGEVQKLPRPWDLESGGAAYGDHVAVRLRLAKVVDSLTLHMPCRFMSADGDSYRFDASTEEGRVANHYHDLFSTKYPPGQGNSYAELREVIMRGATVNQYAVEGFKARNYAAGRADVLIAQTFARGKVPADGGTLHTWRNSTAALKIHISIPDLQRPEPAQQKLF